MQTLDLSSVCDRIALRAPYFSFLDLEQQSDAAVRGTFSAEHRTGYERGPVAAAELVRHLATLGSCAAVLEGTATPAYYLGTKGRLKLMRNTRRDREDGMFHASAEVLQQDRKSLVAQSILSGPDFLAHFRCEYQVLPEPVFARTFKHYRTGPVPHPDDSPYKEPIELDFEAPQERSLIAHSRPLPSSRFAGHFFEYPAWPASIYAETVSRVVGRLLHHMLDKEVEYSVVRLDIDALRLISAAEGVSFHVNCVSASQILSHYVFSAEIRRGETVAAAIEMEVHV
ncbi:MAG: hypothetical protein ABWY00_04020 [Dongiaceae bacterium]